jgi:hypothetical protein
LARYVYEWKPTQFGNRLFRRPGSGPKPPKGAAAPEPTPALTTLKKDELVALAEEQGKDTSGTKADIIERLEGDDDES